MFTVDFEKYFEETGLSEKGRESFSMLHKKMSKADFSASYDAYKEGDEIFSAFISAYAERENIPVEVVNLYLYIRFSEFTYAEYQKRGIPDDIFYLTMSDFPITCRQNVDKGGVYGITQQPERPWLRLHLDCMLYRLGRLQFELIHSNRDVSLGGKTLKKGERCINVHIARYEPLDGVECEKSYALAKEFFKKYYGIETCFFFCHSWLLHPWLLDVLPETSSILRFRNKFEILETEENADDVISYVFMNKCENIEDYPENSSLQKALKMYLTKKHPVGMAMGVRL